MRVTVPEPDEQVFSLEWITKIAIIMIILGIIAIAFPLFTMVASTLMFGLVFIVAGIAQIVYGFQSRVTGQAAWTLILGLLYLLAGIFVVGNSLEGVIAFALVLGITIFVQGVIQVSTAFQMRWISPNWGWMFASGIIGIIFGIFVSSNSPFSEAWMIGALIGINLLFDGVWMLTLHSEQRRNLHYYKCSDPR